METERELFKKRREESHKKFRKQISFIWEFLGKEEDVICSWMEDENATNVAACSKLAHIPEEDMNLLGIEKDPEWVGESKFLAVSVYEYKGIIWAIYYGMPDAFWFKKEDLEKILAL